MRPISKFTKKFLFNTKVFRIKDGLRFKPLEYLCDDIDLDILEEVQ